MCERNKSKTERGKTYAIKNAGGIIDNKEGILREMEGRAEGRGEQRMEWGRMKGANRELYIRMM